MPVKNAIAWIVGAVALAFIVSIGWILLTQDKNPPNTRTVASVLESEFPSTAEQPKQATRSYGISDILAALGLPQGAISQLELEKKPVSDAKRTDLSNVLDVAVAAGSISEDDAEAVLRAYDAGLVEAAKEPLVLNNNGSSS
ncbi:hypothetical protein [uncultured Corynebacterium sp.]|uniref:hypothetical protein n=1 Tax=uncultured Corynebacterium sp. TaxID=159447 RepID=UPI0025E46E38|nr:hypothetical protein [uncultured Corynebacterium sp.]